MGSSRCRSSDNSHWATPVLPLRRSFMDAIGRQVVVPFRVVHVETDSDGTVRHARGGQVPVARILVSRSRHGRCHRTRQLPLPIWCRPRGREAHGGNRRIIGACLVGARGKMEGLSANDKVLIGTEPSAARHDVTARSGLSPMITEQDDREHDRDDQETSWQPEQAKSSRTVTRRH